MELLIIAIYKVPADDTIALQPIYYTLFTDTIKLQPIICCEDNITL